MGCMHGTQDASTYLSMLFQLRQVLLRALRDFNMGKLTADDTGIFMGLLNDLFPGIVEHVPRAMNSTFEEKVFCASACVLLDDVGTFHTQRISFTSRPHA